ncbi:MAG: FGGY-family carbohydrate kinase [SAR324 cluster bacterium]
MSAQPHDLLLSIDCGTQSVRALLFDPQGRMIVKSQVRLDGYTVPQPGWHEHPVEGFWSATAQACQTLWREHAALKPAVRGVSVTTQRGTIMPVDRDGQALYPAITWLDQRKAAQLPRIGASWRILLRLAGASELVRYVQRESECNWLAEHRPDALSRTHKFLLVSGLLNWKLTGRFADSVGSQVAYLPFDFKRFRWSAPNDWKWQALAVRLEQLPELVPVGAKLGEVSTAAAETTGIPAGIPVIAAAADKACEALGAGCLEPDVGAISYGTTATISVNSKRYFEALSMTPPYPAALPGHYSSEVQIFRGYWMVRWFKEQFGHLEQTAAQQSGTTPEALLDRLVTTVPPGAMGLLLQPYWTPGVRNPGPDAKGAIIGFGDVHTRAHVYRAILEGLAYALRDGRERIEKKSHVPVRELRVAGGGSQSDAAMQLTADIFNLPCCGPHTYETAGLGAAIDCAAGIGFYPDVGSAVRAMTRVARGVEPDPAHVGLYDALYSRVYKHMYERLAPLYAQIQAITGYPQLD